MKTQFKILLYFVIFNVVSFVALNASTGGEYLFPGVVYTHPANSTGTITDYETQFNGTQIVDTWQPSGSYGFAGDIFSALNTFWTLVRFLFDGIGMTLEWIGTVIPVAQSALTWVAYIIRAVMAVIAVTMVIEFISGRELME